MVSKSNRIQRRGFGLMEKRYFFFDIDGTLIPETGGQEIPANVRQALDEAQRRGHFCAIATGRGHCEAEKIRQSLGFANMVCDGGNGIVLNHKLISLEPLPYELCRQLVAECEACGYSWGISPEDECYCVTSDSDFPGFTHMDLYIKEEMKIDDYKQAMKLFILCPPGQEDRMPALQKLAWCRYLDHPCIFVEPADKAKGIRYIMDYFHASYEDVVVFGDGKNDFSMFVDDWFCIAMGNAIPELKEKADYITLPSSQEGVAYALKHFGWI